MSDNLTFINDHDRLLKINKVLHKKLFEILPNMEKYGGANFNEHSSGTTVSIITNVNGTNIKDITTLKLIMPPLHYHVSETPFLARDATTLRLLNII